MIREDTNESVKIGPPALYKAPEYERALEAGLTCMYPNECTIMVRRMLSDLVTPEQAAEAHRRVEAEQRLGIVVISVRPETTVS